MLGDKKILIVEDDATRLHDLVVIIDFLGESPIQTAFSSWQDIAAQAADDEVGMIILGNTHGGETLKQHLEGIKNTYELKPVAVVGEYGDINPEWDPYLRHMAIGTLELPITYNALIDAMHRAQRLNVARDAARGGLASRPTHLFRSLVGTSREEQTVRKIGRAHV